MIGNKTTGPSKCWKFPQHFWVTSTSPAAQNILLKYLKKEQNNFKFAETTLKSHLVLFLLIFK
jgi:hypothetical protein